jgi:cell wall assembly regulator SMI1
MSSSPVAALWQRIHAAAPARCERLRDSASASDLRELQELGLPLPPAFLDSLRLHDGEEDPGALFPGGGQLLPVEILLNERDNALDAEAEYPDRGEFDDDDQPLRATIGPVRPILDSRQRLVFLRSDDADYALDFDPAPGGTPAQVIRYNGHVGEGWAVCAPSFEAFLADFAAALEAGAIPDETREIDDSPFDDEGEEYEEDWSAGNEFEDEDEDAFSEDEDDLDPALDELFDTLLNPPPSAWPPLAELPALRAGRLDFATLLAAGKATGDWGSVRELAEGPKAALSDADRALLDAHAALQEGELAAGLEALATLPAAAIDENVLLLRVELLDASGEVGQALAELSLAIEAGGSPRLRARRARLHLQQSGETPYPDSPGKAMRWLGSPAGQQHSAICRDRAVEDLRAALAGENHTGWRFALGDALIESERWDEAIALHEALLERLRALGDEEDPRLERARDGLERARARGEGEEDSSALLEQMDEVLASLRELGAEFGTGDEDMGKELTELRDALASMIEQDEENREKVEANPGLIDDEAEAVAQQLARQHVDTPERFAPFPDADIDRPTRRWLDGAQREFEALGFRCLGTVEPVRNTEVNGQCVPLRVLVSNDERTVAAAWRLQGPFQAYEVVDLESELEDGRILITNNTGAANPFAPPPGLEQMALPLGTALPALFDAHRRRLDAAGSAARAQPDLDAVLAVQEKQRVLKREHARAEGWVSEGDLRNLLGSAYPVLGARVRARLVALLG